MTKHKRDFFADPRLIRTALIAMVIGGCSTVAAYVLLHVINLFTNIFFFQKFSFSFSSPADHHLGLWVIAVPVIGGVIVGLVARYGSEQVRGHGIPEAIEAILFGKSRMSAKVAVLKPLSSGVAIGSGGPFGAEGPIIMTGGAIGSLIAQHFHLTASERKTLLVAGATAGMTAVFGTPLAAILLAVELLLFELRPRSLLPVILACAVAGFCRPLLLDAAPLFPLQTPAVGFTALFSSVVAGVLAGALSSLMSGGLYKVEDAFHRLPIHWMWWPALGGLAVGIGGYFEPRALGVGYDVIGDLLYSELTMQIAFGLLLAKVIIWLLALGSGTSGGVLAPLLMIGAGLGTMLTPLLPGGGSQLWPLVCMAAVLGGVMRSPLTAVMFAFELTHDVNALLPLLVATGVAYGFTVLTMSRSILTEKIARRGFHIFREYGIDPLERQYVEEIMTREVTSVPADMPLSTVWSTYFGPEQKHRGYPVVDNNQRVVGMIDRDTLAACTNEHDTLAPIFGVNAPLVALPSETGRIVAARMASHKVERLPVIADTESNRLIGIVSRSDLVNPSRRYLEEEHTREKLIDMASSFRWRK